MKLQQIYDNLMEVSVINTHEHLYDEKYRLEHIGDWSLLFWHYGITTLKIAGMTNHESDKEALDAGRYLMRYSAERIYNRKVI